MSDNTIGSNNSGKHKVYKNQNTIESIKDLGHHTVNSTVNQVKKIGSDIFDEFFGNQSSDFQKSNEMYDWPSQSEKPIPKKRKEFTLFNYQEHYENDIVKRDIKELTNQIKKEIEFVKKSDSSLLQEVKDIEKLTLESLPDKPGIYHIRFLEIILSILKSLRAKIGESRTWLQAMVSKRKKRGSLFMSLSKKKGTMYSLSQELQSSRSVQ